MNGRRGSCPLFLECVLLLRQIRSWMVVCLQTFLKRASQLGEALKAWGNDDNVSLGHFGTNSRQHESDAVSKAAISSPIQRGYPE